MHLQDNQSLKFNEAYASLNEKQRNAVDILEGPVLVIAGPGTGKTQILGTRIANLLAQRVADAENILCLTYTDAGVTAMKKRLQLLIGPVESKKVGIYTFHSFCNKIIQENQDLFKSSQFRLADTVDKFECIEKVLNTIPSNYIHYKPDQDYKPVLYKMLGLFETIKKEHWALDELKQSIEKDIDELREGPTYRYKRKYKEFKEGDLREKIFKEEVLERYEKTIEALTLYDKYNETLRLNKFYDYNDLINKVIYYFKNNETLLLRYQEQFQYVLVDEFQDTNGSQMEILNLLISYWDQPNVFVVGDGDQAIYRFQGANVKNLQDFKNRYHPEVIDLRENYRSSQAILNAAEFFIKSNLERLHEDINSDHTLIARTSYSNVWPQIIEYQSRMEEALDVASQIEDLIKNQNCSPEKIAILYRNNKDGEEFARALTIKEISYVKSKEINILDYPIIKQIIQILKYLESEFHQPLSNDSQLYEILHYPFIPISTLEIGLLAYGIKIRNNQDINNDSTAIPISLREAIGKEEFLITQRVGGIEQFLKLSSIIDQLIKYKDHFTLQSYLEKVLKEFNIINFVISKNQDLEVINVINAFYNYVQQLSEIEPNITINRLCETLDRIQNYKLSIPLIVSSSNELAVRLSTYHSSKGLEFNHVFMVDNIVKSKGNQQGYRIPPGYSYNESNTDIEEERRLFYVGMTRAKETLKISYSTVGKDGKTLESTPLIDELKNFTDIASISRKFNNEIITNTIVQNLNNYSKPFERIPKNYLDSFFENFKLSASTLEKYLDCPLKFYYEYILKVPTAKNIYMGFGTAVHKTLEEYLKSYPNIKSLNEQQLQEIYNKNLRRVESNFTPIEWNAYKDLGFDCLPDFIRYYQDKWLNLGNSLYEYNFRNSYYKKVPITGKIDRIDQLALGFRIIDYKTGKANTPMAKSKLMVPTDKNPYGGEYWRQMVFYNILADSESKFTGRILDGIFYYVIPDRDRKFYSKEFIIDHEARAFVGHLIETTYEKMINDSFEQGCGKPDCIWCQQFEFSSTGFDLDDSIE